MNKVVWVLLVTVLTVGCGSTPSSAPQPPPEVIGQPAQASEAALQKPAPDGFVLIKGGTFIMGSPEDEAGRGIAPLLPEGPQHQVTISPFHMGKYEVTQKEYQEVRKSNPSYFKGTDRPVEKVSWLDAVEYCNARSKMEGLTPVYTISGSGDKRKVSWDRSANGYRLPTEAEWEYACRAGTTTAFNTGREVSGRTGWYDNNSEKKTHPVGERPPNAWGLYDMHGNIGEWCWDRAPVSGGYSGAAQTDPVNQSTWDPRIVRGGNWSSPPAYIRSAARYAINPWVAQWTFGFRVVRAVQE